jgi:hypothetical protein
MADGWRKIERGLFQSSDGQWRIANPWKLTVRHVAPCERRRWRVVVLSVPAGIVGPGLMQRPGEAGGRLGRGIARCGVKRPDNVTAGRYCQTPACVLARPKGRAKAIWW